MFLFAGTCAVVGNGGNVGDKINFETGATEDPKSRITTWPGALDKDLDLFEALGFGVGNDFFDGDGSSVRSGFFGTGETRGTSAPPVDSVAGLVSNGD